MPATKTPQSGLKEYKAKRNFAKTPEPSGNKAPRKKIKDRYFCVQKHLASHLHYDFRLEHNGVLLSWAVPRGPSLNPKDKRLAMRVEDHPLDYGEFEGVIPEGYGAGIVVLWDKGTWKPLVDDVDAALAKGELKFELDGYKLKGGWVLVRTRDERTWLLIKHRDQWAGEIDVTQLFPNSVKSGGDFPDILAAEKPDLWQSHRPAQGGVSGKLFEEIIEKAARIKLDREKKKKKPARATAKSGSASTSRSARQKASR